MLIGGALANALAFTGSSYLFHRLSAENIDAERKRHVCNNRGLTESSNIWYLVMSYHHCLENLY